MNGAPAAICDAFACGEFARARRLWETYAGELRAAILSGSASPAALAEAREALDRSRLAVQVFRARAVDSLNRARVARAYTALPAARPRLVRTSL